MFLSCVFIKLWLSGLCSTGLGSSDVCSCDAEKLQLEQCLVTLGNGLFPIYFPFVGDGAWLLAECERGCFLKNVIFCM